MNKLIIDTDPGVDDALAIAFAVCSRLDVSGITTVYGNVTVQNSTKNVLKILTVLNKDIPVFEGLANPLKGSATKASSHGESGIGDLLVSPRYKKQQASAMSFIINQLQEADGLIDIVAIGPLTNIAYVIKNYPDLLKKIGQIVIMGGAINAPGNITKVAEFNAFNDPFALQIVIDSPVKTVLIPADVCRKVVFKMNTFESIKNRAIQKSMQLLTEAYIRYYQQNDDFEAFEGGVMYDLLAVGYMINPGLFNVVEGCVSVSVKPGKNYGRTTLSDNIANCLVVRDVKANQLTRLFIQTINDNSR